MSKSLLPKSVTKYLVPLVVKQVIIIHRPSSQRKIGFTPHNSNRSSCTHECLLYISPRTIQKKISTRVFPIYSVHERTTSTSGRSLLTFIRLVYLSRTITLIHHCPPYSSKSRLKCFTLSSPSTLSRCILDPSSL